MYLLGTKFLSFSPFLHSLSCPSSAVGAMVFYLYVVNPSFLTPSLLYSHACLTTLADVGAFLISPFVGRITDWYKAKTGTANYESEEDPGVISVRNIYKYYKNFGRFSPFRLQLLISPTLSFLSLFLFSLHSPSPISTPSLTNQLTFSLCIFHETTGHKTVVMGASFRNKGQILALSGCDKLTISPTLLKEMQNSTDEVKQHLFADHKDESIEKLSFNEAQFRYALNGTPPLPLSPFALFV